MCMGYSTSREELYICAILILCSRWGGGCVFLEENKVELCLGQKFPLGHLGRSSFASKWVTMPPAPNSNTALGWLTHTALHASSISASKWAAKRPAQLTTSPSAGRGAWQGVQASHLQTKRHSLWGRQIIRESTAWAPQEGKLVKALGQGYLLRNESPVENTQSRSISLPTSSAHYSVSKKVMSEWAMLLIIIFFKKKDGHATHNFVRTPHPEHAVPLTLTASTRDWAVSRCQWICHHFCSSRMRWEGLKACIWVVLTTTQPAAFLPGEEREQLPGAVNSAQPAKSCHLHMQQGSSQTTREEGRGGRDGSSQLPERMWPTPTTACFFSSESKLPESAILRTLWQTLPMFSNVFWVTIPNEITRLAGGLANTPKLRTASLSYIWAWAAWTIKKSHITPALRNEGAGGREATIICYCQH